MAKRFIETTIWTQNKWFRTLKPEYKLIWFYIITNCDAVGVWEDDFELASFIIGFDYSKESVYKEFAGKIKDINSKKIWVIDFCNFQYGTLKEENINNKPHQSYISLLKKHSLWIDYTKTIKSLKETETETEKDKRESYQIQFDKVKSDIILPEGFEPVILLWLKHKSEKSQSYKDTGLRTLLNKVVKEYRTASLLKEAIEYSMSNNYSGIFKEKNNGTSKKVSGDINTGWKDKETGHDKF